MQKRWQLLYYFLFYKGWKDLQYRGIHPMKSNDILNITSFQQVMQSVDTQYKVYLQARDTYPKVKDTYP